MPLSYFASGKKSFCVQREEEEFQVPFAFVACVLVWL